MHSPILVVDDVVHFPPILCIPCISTRSLNCLDREAFLPPPAFSLSTVGNESKSCKSNLISKWQFDAVLSWDLSEEFMLPISGGFVGSVNDSECSFTSPFFHYQLTFSYLSCSILIACAMHAC